MEIKHSYFLVENFIVENFFFKGYSWYLSTTDCYTSIHPNTILIYRFLEIYEKYGGPDEGTLKLKKPTQLQEILDVTRTLLEGLDDPVLSPITENHNKLNQMKTVLEM